jgi:hypothetical protein
MGRCGHAVRMARSRRPHSRTCADDWRKNGGGPGVYRRVAALDGDVGRGNGESRRSGVRPGASPSTVASPRSVTLDSAERWIRSSRVWLELGKEEGGRGDCRLHRPPCGNHGHGALAGEQQPGERSGALCVGSGRWERGVVMCGKGRGSGSFYSLGRVHGGWSAALRCTGPGLGHWPALRWESVSNTR